MGKVFNVVKYVCYVPSCPRCEMPGSLIAFFSSRSLYVWCGPYFRVHHHEHRYDAERYRESRNRGDSTTKANNLSHRNINSRYCYLSKQAPREHMDQVISVLNAFDPTMKFQERFI